MKWSFPIISFVKSFYKTVHILKLQYILTGLKHSVIKGMHLSLLTHLSGMS